MKARPRQETSILAIVIGAMAIASIANLYFHFSPVEGFEVASEETGLSWIVIAVVSLAIATYFVSKSDTVFGKLFWASGIIYSISRFIVVLAVSPELERLVFGVLLGLLAIGNVVIWLVAVRLGQNVLSFHRVKGT